jgi:hypothetical protein
MKKNWKESSVADILMTQRLRWSLRLRMCASWFYFALEIGGFILLLVLGTLQAAMGEAGTAAVFVGLALVCAAASWWARRHSLRSARGSLLELIDASIRHARRGVRMAWANYFMTLATAAAILGLYFSSLGRPDDAYHDGDRVVASMVILGIYAIGVGTYHAFARRRERRFAAMRARFEVRAGDGVNGA